MSEVATLDHVGLVGRQMAPLLETFGRLGFAPTTPRPLFARDPRSGEAVSLDQTSAHLVFDDGYVELSAVHSESPRHHLAAYLGRHEGLHILAFGVSDIAAAHARCQQAGLPVTAPARAGRAIEYGERHGEARFEWFMVEAGAAPEGLLCCVHHLTPELVFQPEVQQHPNGTRALAGVYVVTDDARRATARLAQVSGATASPGGRLELAGGWLQVLSPAAFEQRFPDNGIPPTPCLAGFSVRATGLPVLRQRCAAAGIVPRERPDGLWIPAALAGGCVVEFAG